MSRPPRPPRSPRRRARPSPPPRPPPARPTARRWPVTSVALFLDFRVKKNILCFFVKCVLVQVRWIQSRFACCTIFLFPKRWTGSQRKIEPFHTIFILYISFDFISFSRSEYVHVSLNWQDVAWPVSRSASSASFLAFHLARCALKTLRKFFCHDLSRPCILWICHSNLLAGLCHSVSVTLCSFEKRGFPSKAEWHAEIPSLTVVLHA